MTFVRGSVPQDWRPAVTVPLYKGKKREINLRIIEVLA